MFRLSAALLALLVIAATGPSQAAENFSTAARSYSAGMYGSAARHWLNLAEAGHGPAQYNIGRMYFYGQGMRKDPIEAFKWFLLASESGVEQGRIAANIIRDKLTNRQIVEATVRARDLSARIRR